MSRKKKTDTDTPDADADTFSAPHLDRINAFFSGSGTGSEGCYGVYYESGDTQMDNELKLPTGSSKLDEVLDGGYNAYSMSMFFGDKESGKTTQGLVWGANWQRHFGDKGVVVVYDAEGRLTAAKIKASGIDTTKGRLIVVKSNAAEFILQNIIDLMENNPDGMKYFFIVDSINALTTADERSKTLSEAEARAGVARVNSMAFKKLSLPLHVLGHHLYLCSQIRAGNMTGYGGAGNKAGGGKAPEFYGDVIAQMGLAWDGSSPRYIKDGEKIVGQYTEYAFRKTYNESTGLKLQVPIKYKHIGGVWSALETMDQAIAWGLLLKKGSWYSLQTELLKESAAKAGISQSLLSSSVQGMFGCATFFEDNPDLRTFLNSYIRSMAA